MGATVEAIDAKHADVERAIASVAAYLETEGFTRVAADTEETEKKGNDFRSA